VSDLGGKMARGAAWMISLRLADRAIGVVSTLILARLLVPDDFGLVAMAMSVYAVIELLSDFSVEVALVQNQNAEKRHYDTAWTFNVCFGVIATVVLSILAKPAALLFKEARLEDVVYVLAASMLIRGFQNIGLVDFQKKLQFNKDFIFMFSRRVVGFCATIGIAIWLRNYWAMVIGTLVGTAFSVVVSYIMHPFRPRIEFSASSELFNFSKWLLINNLLFFVLIRSSDFVIGRLAGARDLGFYKLSYELSNLPTTELIMPITRAVFPGFSQISYDLALLRKGFLDVVSLVALIGLPVGAGIVATAGLFVPVLLGDKWIETIPLIQLLAIVGAINVMQGNIGSVYLALGKPRILTILMAVRVTILVPILIYFTGKDGASGAAFAVLVGSFVAMPISYIVMFRTLGLRFSSFVPCVWRPLLSAIVMAIAVLWHFSIWPAEVDEIGFAVVRLCGVVAGGATVYFALLGAFWVLAGRPEGAESLVMMKVRNFVGRR
jgi:lipopolysaccharide exporter